MRRMRTVAGLLNILLGVALAFAVATVVNLEFPGNVFGVTLLVGAAVTLAAVPDWGGLVSAVPTALGIPVLVASVLAFLANRRAYSSAGS
jgi:hypothetical protein